MNLVFKNYVALLNWAALLLLSLLGFCSLPSLAVSINKNPLSATAEFEGKHLPPGANSTVHLELKLAPPHIAYSDQFKLEVRSPAGFQVSTPTIKGELEFDDVHSKKKKKGIKKRATLSAFIEAPSNASAGMQTIVFDLTYQACTDDYCLLPKTIQVPLEINISNDYSQGSSQEKPLGIFERAQKYGWFALFVFIFLSGILTSFTPCVFPIIPITMAVIGHKSQGQSTTKGFLLSLSYVSGIALTYAGLGVFAASTGALFGGYLGHPLVGIAIALLFFAMALSMFGLYDLEAPLWLRNKLQLTGTGSGFTGAFFAGIIAGVIASPCVGPVLVAILAFVAQTQNLILGFFLLLTFAFGLGTLFLVLGTFSSAINKLPKSGPWLVRVKYVFGVILISGGIYFAYPSVKPLFVSSTTTQATTKDSSKAHSDKIFVPYSEQALKEAALQGKAVVIDFYADWCAACKDLERETFPHPEVRRLKEKVVFLKFDATNPNDEFKKLQAKYDIFGLPHLVFYSPDGTYQEDATLTGFESGPDFAQRLKGVLSVD